MSNPQLLLSVTLDFVRVCQAVQSCAQESRHEKCLARFECAFHRLGHGESFINRWPSWQQDQVVRETPAHKCITGSRPVERNDGEWQQEQEALRVFGVPSPFEVSVLEEDCEHNSIETHQQFEDGSRRNELVSVLEGHFFGRSRALLGPRVVGKLVVVFACGEEQQVERDAGQDEP